MTASQPPAPAVSTTALDVRGPYDLAEVALMGFGHRDERSFDGVMRMAFCLDPALSTAVGVEARQAGGRVELRVQTAGPERPGPSRWATRVWPPSAGRSRG